MKIKVEKELPKDMYVNQTSNTKEVHAYQYADTMYISQELKDLVESSMELKPITNTELKQVLKGMRK